jgi:hypothetical protein
MIVCGLLAYVQIDGGFQPHGNTLGGLLQEIRITGRKKSYHILTITVR